MNTLDVKFQDIILRCSIFTQVTLELPQLVMYRSCMSHQMLLQWGFEVALLTCKILNPVVNTFGMSLQGLLQCCFIFALITCKFINPFVNTFDMSFHGILPWWSKITLVTMVSFVRHLWSVLWRHLVSKIRIIRLKHLNLSFFYQQLWKIIQCT